MSAKSAPSPFARLWESAGMLLVLALLFLICALGVENFLSVANLRGTQRRSPIAKGQRPGGGVRKKA